MERAGQVNNCVTRYEEWQKAGGPIGSLSRRAGSLCYLSNNGASIKSADRDDGRFVTGVVGLSKIEQRSGLCTTDA